MGSFRAIRQLFQKLDIVNRFFNGFPKPDFNFKGQFYEKEFIEHGEFYRSRFGVITGRLR